MRRLLIVLAFAVALPTPALADTPTQLGPGALQRYYDGGFVFRVPPGVNRTLRAGYRAAASDVALACSGTASLHTRAGVTLNAAPHRVRAGRTARFYGRVLAAGRQARGPAGVRRAQVAHVQDGADQRGGPLQRSLSLPGQRVAVVPLPRAGAARGAVPVFARRLEGVGVRARWTQLRC